MSKRPDVLIDRVYEKLNEAETQANAVFPRSRVLQSLNEALWLIWESQMAVDTGSGLEQEDVEVVAGASRASLPHRLLRILRVCFVAPDGAEGDDIALETQAERTQWLEGNELVFGTPFRESRTVRFYVQRVPPAMHVGTLPSQVGMAVNEVKLPETATVGEVDLQDQYYKGAWIYLESGKGAGQVRQITSYTGLTTRKCTLDYGWETVPDATTGYSIVSLVEDHMGELLVDGAAEMLRGEDAEDGGARLRVWQQHASRRVMNWAARRRGARRVRLTHD